MPEKRKSERVCARLGQGIREVERWPAEVGEDVIACECPLRRGIVGHCFRSVVRSLFLVVPSCFRQFRSIIVTSRRLTARFSSVGALIDAASLIDHAQQAATFEQSSSQLPTSLGGWPTRHHLDSICQLLIALVDHHGISRTRSRTDVGT
jgi:hypothetical protein